MSNYVRCIVFEKVYSRDNSGIYTIDGLIFTEDMEKISAEFVPEGAEFKGESEFQISNLPDCIQLDTIFWQG
jgi:hypothetical protein